MKKAKMKRPTKFNSRIRYGSRVARQKKANEILQGMSLPHDTPKSHLSSMRRKVTKQARFCF